MIKTPKKHTVSREKKTALKPEQEKDILAMANTFLKNLDDAMHYSVTRDDKGNIQQTTYAADGHVQSVALINPQHQLVQIQSFGASSRRPVYHRFKYDTYGNLVGQSTSFGHKHLSSVTEWWRKPIRTTTFSPWTGRALSFKEGVHEPDCNGYEGMTEGFFEKGRISMIIAHDFMDQIRHVQIYKMGELVQEVSYSLNRKLSSQTRYVQHQEGAIRVKLTSKSIFDGEEKCLRRDLTEERFDAAGNVVMALYYQNGALSRKVIYTYKKNNIAGEKIECLYNQQNQCTEEKFLSPSDEVLGVVRYEYDGNGKCVDSYKWNGQKWMSERFPSKEAPDFIAMPLERKVSAKPIVPTVGACR